MAYVKAPAILANEARDIAGEPIYYLRRHGINIRKPPAVPANMARDGG